MIMHRCNFDPALDQFRHHGIDLGFEENEIAHDHCAVMHRLEGHPSAERERRLDRDAVEGHRKIGARKAVSVHVAGDGRLSSKCRINFLPIDFLCGCRPQHERRRLRTRAGVVNAYQASQIGFSPGYTPAIQFKKLVEQPFALTTAAKIICLS